VAKKLLDRSDIITVLKEVSRERMPETVAGGTLADPRAPNRLRDCSLDDCLVNVMTALVSRLKIDPSALLWEHPLPPPIASRLRVFPIQGVRHENLAETIQEILLMDNPNPLELISKRPFDRFGQHRKPVLEAFPVTNRDLVGSEIDVLNSKPKTLHQTKSGAIQETDNQPIVTLEIM
jgi:hypothetical protein